MVNYRLDADEAILLQTSDVMRYDGDDEIEIQELCLTNKHLIFVYDSFGGVFSKSEITVDRIPLDDIKYINGVVQVKSVNDDDYGRTLQILYTNGKRELIELGGSPKKVYPQWQDAISNAVVSYIESSRAAPAAPPAQEAPPVPPMPPVQPTPNVTTTGAETKKVVYCSVCGEKNNVGARFCQGCGATIGAVPKQEEAPAPKKPAEPAPKVEQQSTYTERKQEYAGRIIKCPACGAELPSFVAICPDCGHEINSQNVSPYIREFSKSIDEYDRAIANDPEPPKTGWKTWSKNKRIIWVILNIFTSFIPWVIYLAFPLVKPFIFRKSVPGLSTSEKQKAALIENATFPNEREATIEAMMFTKSKMAFLASEKFNRKTQYWINLWNTKAEQLNQRAGIILKGDKVVEATYADIISCKNKVDKHVQMRAIIGAVIIVAYLVFIAVSGSLLGGIGNIFSGIGLPSIGSSQNGKDNFEWLETGLCAKVPAIDSNEGHYMTNSDVELNVRVEDISYSQFEKHITACKDMGYTVDAEKDTDSYTAYNAEGYYLDLQYWGYGGKNGPLDINLLAPLAGDENFTWPTGAVADVIPKVEISSGKLGVNNNEEIEISLYEFTKEDFDTYVQQCKDAGFNIDGEEDKAETWHRYEAYNSEGYRIRVSVDNMKELKINMRVPRKKDAISWPSTGPAAMLPKPDNCIGEVSIDFDWSFSAYISDMTIDDFDAYVEKCINSGFEKCLRTEHYFSADKGDDISITIEYVGFNTVYISIDDRSKL